MNRFTLRALWLLLYTWFSCFIYEYITIIIVVSEHNIVTHRPRISKLKRNNREVQPLSSSWELVRSAIFISLRTVINRPLWPT